MFWLMVGVTMAVSMAIAVFAGWRLDQAGQLDLILWRYPWLMSLVNLPLIGVSLLFARWWIAAAFTGVLVMSLGIVMNARRGWPEPEAQAGTGP